MIKSFLIKLNATHGIAFPIVLLGTFLIVSLLVAGLTPMITTQSKFVAYTEDQLIARYAAETGVKRGLLLARNDYDSLPKGTNPNTITGVENQTESLLNSGGISYTYSYKYVSGNTSQNPERMEVTASATSGNTTVQSIAWIVFKTEDIPGFKSPTLEKLVESANNGEKNCYHWESPSNNSKNRDYYWKYGDVNIGGEIVKGAYPEDGDSENIILFQDNLESAEFTLEYDVAFDKGGRSSGGLGILYGASDSDNAENFNAYCVKFNNDRQSFSVTKFVAYDAYKGDPKYAGRPVELVLPYEIAGGTTAADVKTYVAAFQPNGKDDFGNDLGRCSIPYSEFIKKFGIDPNEGKFSIRIETKAVPIDVKYPNGKLSIETRLRHTISLWNYNSTKEDKFEPVLSFIDFSDLYDPNNPKCQKYQTYALAKTNVPVPNPKIDLIERKKQNKRIRTGLRTWNVEACAFDSRIKHEKDHKVYDIRQIIWKK